MPIMALIHQIGSHGCQQPWVFTRTKKIWNQNLQKPAKPASLFQSHHKKKKHLQLEFTNPLMTGFKCTRNQCKISKSGHSEKLKFSCALSPKSQESLNPEIEGANGRGLDIHRPITSKVEKEEAAGKGLTLEDLMSMIKDAEKNILILNNLRARAVNELKEARSENENLQGQAKVLHARLAEAEARVHLAEQRALKNEMLGEELEELKSQLTEQPNPPPPGEDKTREALLERVAQLEGELGLKDQAQGEEKAGLERALAEASGKLLEQAEALTGLEEKLRESDARLAALGQQAEVGKALEARIAELEEAEEKAGNRVQETAEELVEVKEEGALAKQRAEELAEELEGLRAKVGEFSGVQGDLEEALAENERLRLQIEELGQGMEGVEKAKGEAQVAVEEERKKFQDEVSSLAARLAVLEGEAEALRGEVQEKEGVLGGLRDTETANEKLRSELEEVRAQSDEASKKLEKASMERQELEARVAELAGAVETKEGELAALGEASEKLRATEAALGELQERIRLAEREKDEIVEAFAAEKATLSEQLKAAEALKDETEGRIKALEGEVSSQAESLEEEKKKAGEALSAVAASQETAGKLKAELEEALGKKQAALEALEKELEEAREAKETLLAEASGLRDQVEETELRLTHDNETLKKQLEETVTSQQALSSELDGERGLREALEGEMERLKAEVEVGKERGERVDKLETQLSAMAAKLNEYSRNANLLEMIQEEKRELEGRLEKMKEVDSDDDKVRSSNRKLRLRLGELESQLAKQERAESALTQQVAMLTQQSLSAASLAQKKDEIAAELTRTRALLADSQEALKAKEDSLEASERQLTALKDETARLSSEASSLQERLQKAEAAAEQKKVLEEEKKELAEELRSFRKASATAAEEKLKLEAALSLVKSELSIAVETSRKEKARLEDEGRKLLGNARKAEGLQREKARLEEEVRKLLGSLRRSEALEREKAQLEEEVRKLQGAASRAESAAREKSKLERDFQSLKTSLARAESALQEKTKLEADLRKVLQQQAAKFDQVLKDKAASLQALEADLLQTKTAKDKLEAQVDELQPRVQEGEDRRVQERQLAEQMAQLKAQLVSAKQRAAEAAEAAKELEAVKPKAAMAEKLQLEKAELERVASEARQVADRDRQHLVERVGRLQEALTEEREKGKRAAAAARKEMEELQKGKMDAEGKLLERSAEMERLRGWAERAKELEGQVARLKEAGDHVGPLRRSSDEARQRSKVLEESLAQAEAKLARVQGVGAENKKLRETVEGLRGQLLASDEALRNQVEVFRVEVEGFQEKLEAVTRETRGSDSLPLASETLWEDWSCLLMRIDDLMLSGKLAKADAGELRGMAWRREERVREACLGLVAEGSDARLLGALKKLLKGKTKPGLHIIHIAAEMAPVAKVGGLADVVTGLGRALQKKGHLVEVILPKYDCMDYSRIKGLKVMDFDLPSFFDGTTFNNKIWRGLVEGLPVYFIEPHHPGKLFWRNAFYGESDDFKRFTYFCRAALEFMLKAGKKPDIVHSHDWQTAAVAPLYWDIYHPLGLNSAQVVFTCHNFEYQGTESPSALTSCGLNPEALNRQDRMQDNFMADRINMLKGGFVFSNLITTVSPTYAMEVRGPEGGRGLHVTLANYEKKFHGVLNGIDFEAWDPANDPLLPYEFDADSVDRKWANKAELRQKLGLSECLDGDKPLVGCITRLVPQKGVHLIRHAIYRTRDQGGQFVLLGNSPVPEIQRDFENIAREMANSPDIRLILKYDEGLSHVIYGACDIFIIPSLFEPCGLTQLIAMRYGAIPVVRKTGGLADSVFDVDDPRIPEEKKNGFTFTATDESGLNYALDRAIGYYYNHHDWWQDLVSRTMRMDFSWEESSQKYVELYETTIESAKK